MSFLRFLTIKSFRHFHPDWNIVLYRMPEALAKEKGWHTEQAQDAFSYKGRDYSPQLKPLDVFVVPWEPGIHLPQNLSPSHACDFFQWELLSMAGGWYSDMDILWTGSLENINSDVVFCLSDGWMTIGLMASSPENGFFDDVLQTAISNYSKSRYQSTGAETLYTMAGIGKNWPNVKNAGAVAILHLNRKYTKLKFLNLHQNTVYPFNYKSINKIFEQYHELPEHTKGIHWFGVDKLSQKWNCRINHTNWNNYKSTFTSNISVVYQ